MFEFHVVPGSAVKTILREEPALAAQSVQAAYLAHHDGQTTNPDSYFLRFPDEPRNRIIALPAALRGSIDVAGIKWIASFPENIKKGVPRASAVLILNDPKTGYPFACIEAALISSARTAACAVLGAYWLDEKERNVRSIAFIGAGVIARAILDEFRLSHWTFRELLVHDVVPSYAEAFAKYARTSGHDNVRAEDRLADVMRADILVFATSAGTPYVSAPLSFSPGQVVLNISLRDIAPELIASAVNIFDDVEHCFKANTSPHLAEQVLGHRRFVTGTLAGLIRGEVTLDRSRPLIFSPFGMGVLDLALGVRVFEAARRRELTLPVANFFGETVRW
jgi:2,3-diaminopropionate biosynthesis protein SbnB